MLNVTTNTKPVYIDIEEGNAIMKFSNTFNQYLYDFMPHFNHSLVIICIGSDRATGDSLGPLIGYKLRSISYPTVKVYGDLDNPVHAKNLQATIDTINTTHPNSLILAIDASLGSIDKVGHITLGTGPIYPGAGVKKQLPPIGHFHITGIVNFSSFMNMSILQSTRLSLVMKMADIISLNIKYCLWNFFKVSHKKEGSI